MEGSRPGGKVALIGVVACGRQLWEAPAHEKHSLWEVQAGDANVFERRFGQEAEHMGLTAWERTGLWRSSRVRHGSWHTSV